MPWRINKGDVQVAERELKNPEAMDLSATKIARDTRLLTGSRSLYGMQTAVAGPNVEATLGEHRRYLDWGTQGKLPG